MKYLVAFFYILFFLQYGCGKHTGGDKIDPTPEHPTDGPIVDQEPGSEPPSEPIPPVIEAPDDPVVVEDPIDPEPDPEPIPNPTPEEDFKFNIKFGGSSTYNTSARRVKYEKAIQVVQDVIRDPEFKKRVLAHTYGGKVGFASSSKTPAQVYKHMMDGNETLQNTVDNEMDLEVRFYYANNSTVGYTYSSVKYIYVNTKFFDSYKLSSVAANMIHEWLHKLGYGHDSSSTSRRPYSVPYGVGSIMRSIGDKYD